MNIQLKCEPYSYNSWHIIKMKVSCISRMIVAEALWTVSKETTITGEIILKNQQIKGSGNCPQCIEKMEKEHLFKKIY